MCGKVGKSVTKKYEINGKGVKKVQKKVREKKFGKSIKKMWKQRQKSVEKCTMYNVHNTIYTIH